MKDRMTGIVLWLLLVGGVTFFNYPTWANIYNHLQQGQVISTYRGNIRTAQQQKLAGMLAAARQYNEVLSRNPTLPMKDAFDSEAAVSGGEAYYELLNPSGDGMMGIIEIPKIRVWLPIYHGIGQEVLAQGVGHVEETSLPVGGARTHSILTAHRGLPSAELFTDLDQVGSGDVFYLHILEQVLAYQVDRVETVLPEEINEVVLADGKDYVTLVTCTPYGINSHRILVRGSRIPYREEDRTDTAGQELRSPDWLLDHKAFLISNGALMILIIGQIVRRIKKSRGGKKNVEKN